MATSNANTNVPPTEDAECNEKESKVTFPAPENFEITPRKKFTTLLSMIGQFWPSTVLNTWAEEDNSQ
eukprot:9137437-Ditylum_brightwellii.AAC.1